MKLNGSPLATTTDYVDTPPNLSTVSYSYYVRPVVNGVEQAPSESYTLPANPPTQQYLSIPLQVPAGGTTPDGVSYTYSANDCSVGDLDGDGQYEIIVKWDPSNSKDNSQSGYTGNVYLDAYKLDGTLMWRIDLGINIRAAHITHSSWFTIWTATAGLKSPARLRHTRKTEWAIMYYCPAIPSRIIAIHRVLSFPGRNI